MVDCPYRFVTLPHKKHNFDADHWAHHPICLVENTTCVQPQTNLVVSLLLVGSLVKPAKQFHWNPLFHKNIPSFNDSNETPMAAVLKNSPSFWLLATWYTYCPTNSLHE